MVRLLMSLGLLLALAPSVYAQSDRGTRPGDTVSVVVHKVRADKRVQIRLTYEKRLVACVSEGG